MSDECSDMNVHYTLNPFRKRLEMGKAHYPHTIAVQVPIKIKTKKNTSTTASERVHQKDLSFLDENKLTMQI